MIEYIKDVWLDESLVIARIRMTNGRGWRGSQSWKRSWETMSEGGTSSITKIVFAESWSELRRYARADKKGRMNRSTWRRWSSTLVRMRRSRWRGWWDWGSIGTKTDGTRGWGSHDAREMINLTKNEDRWRWMRWPNHWGVIGGIDGERSFWEDWLRFVEEIVFGFRLEGAWRRLTWLGELTLATLEQDVGEDQFCAWDGKRVTSR